MAKNEKLNLIDRKKFCFQTRLKQIGVINSEISQRSYKLLSIFGGMILFLYHAPGSCTRFILQC